MQYYQRMIFCFYTFTVSKEMTSGFYSVNPWTPGDRGHVFPTGLVSADLLHRIWSKCHTSLRAQFCFGMRFKKKKKVINVHCCEQDIWGPLPISP